MVKTWKLLGILLVTPALLGADCGGGSGSGGSPARFTIRSPDPRCVSLPERFPPGFDFIPGSPGRVLAANFQGPSALIPFDVEREPIGVAPGASDLVIPDDSDGDGSPESVLRPKIDDVFGVAADLALVTMSDREQVFFAHPDGVVRSFAVSAPAALEPWRYARLPAPGEPAAQRTALSTWACLEAPPAAETSLGEPLEAVLRRFCNPERVSFLTSLTAGAALQAGRLFVPVSNRDGSSPAESPRFLPGAVLVFDIDLASDPPRVAPSADAPAIFTSGYNPTEATAYTTPSGRELLLVSVSGSFAIAPDDPSTDAIEAAQIPLTEGAIDVIDARALRLVARYPLADANPSFRRLAIDPSGRVALAGDVARRQVVAIDLAPLALLPAADALAEGDVIALDGSTPGWDNAVVFDGRSPLPVPALAGGAPRASCPGSVQSVAFSSAGDRAFALEDCDGALVTLDVDVSGTPSVTELRERISVLRVEPLVAARRVESLGRPQQPDSLKVRPGVPGVDFSGPDIFFTVGEPEGLLCGARVDSLPPLQ